MAKLQTQIEWHITLTTPELRLILKALGARLHEDEQANAVALGNHLTALRATCTRAVVMENDKLLANLEYAGTK